MGTRIWANLGQWNVICYIEDIGPQGPRSAFSGCCARSAPVFPFGNLPARLNPLALATFLGGTWSTWWCVVVAGAGVCVGCGGVGSANRLTKSHAVKAVCLCEKSIFLPTSHSPLLKVGVLFVNPLPTSYKPICTYLVWCTGVPHTS
jgi:hypothetical protein